MRIAHVITRMIIGGAQENTLFTCQDLVSEYDDDVLLITGPALGPEGDLLSANRGQQVPVKVIDSLRRMIHPLRDWQAYRAIKRALREFRPDVVHTHSAKGGILGRYAAHAVGIPAIVHTVHGAPFHNYQGRAGRLFYQWCERRAASRCHHLVSVADAMTDLMLTANIAPPDKFTTIYSGMDVEPFLNAHEHRDAVRKKYGISDDQVVIGKVARLFELKGHEFVVAAAREVIAENANTRFMFVGDGILREQLQGQIERAGLQDYFIFTGLVNPEQIPSMLAAMDVLVHTSLREGLARALPQALITGKPVVSFDIDGAREVAINDETGFLIPAEDTAGLAKALGALVVDPMLRERLGSAGRERFTEQFRHQRMTAQLRLLYQQLLD